jgi:hypothetical protein
MTVETTTTPYWRTTDEQEQIPVDVDEATDAWAEEARRILTAVAGTYHRLIDRTDLAAEVQEASGVRTTKNSQYWLSQVLARVAAVNVDRHEPPLAALVVHRPTGAVGESYDEVLRLAGLPLIDDETTREKHAAAARMECYRWAGATMPADGGHPALAPRLEQRIVRDRRRARAEAPPNVCPSCFMAVPATGICDSCG